MTDNERNVLSGYLLDESVTLTTDELGNACCVEVEQIVKLVEEGILEPVEVRQGKWCFSASHLGRAHKAIRLQRDLQLNLAGVALALDLLDEVERLHSRLRYLEGRG